MLSALIKANSLAIPILIFYWMALYYGYETISYILIGLWFVVLIGMWVLFYYADSD